MLVSGTLPVVNPEGPLVKGDCTNPGLDPQLPVVRVQKCESEPAHGAYHYVERRSNFLRRPWTFENRLQLGVIAKLVKHTEETEVEEGKQQTHS